VKLLNIPLLLCVVLATRAFAAAESKPLTDEQSRVLESVRGAALKYAHQLPDFICTQTTSRQVTKGSADLSHANSLSLRGQPLTHDTFEEQLTYVGGKESYSVVSVNHRKAKDSSHLQFNGAISAGEFGTVVAKVFAPASKTTFTWDKEAKINGRTAWEFRFHVPKESGTAVIFQQRNYAVVAAYSGEVIVDPETYDVIELSSSVDVPADSPIQKVERKIEYGVQTIAGRDCYLPVRSELHMEQGYLVFDNQIEFKDYHHFVSDSSVQYGDEAMR
jgi:hypothetical protein